MNKYILNLTMVFSTILLLSACGGGGGGTTSPVTGMKRASTLVLSDFDTSDVNLTKAEFITELNDQSSFFFNDPTPDSAESVCMKNLLKQEVETTEAGDGTYIVDIPEVDVTQCFPDYTRVTLSYYMDGLSDPIAKGTYDLNERQSQYRSLIIIERSSTRSGHSYTSNKYTATTGNNFAEACVKASPLTCKYFTKKIVNSSSENYHTLDTFYLIRDNLGFTGNNDTYFNSGAATFTLNNWTGTMSYTDKDTAPTYTANSLTESVSGTFTYTP